MTAPTVDHIGVIVEALEPAIAAMSLMLPGAPVTRRSLPEVGLEVAEFRAANLIIELLQYTSEVPGLARRTMGSGTGLNHLSISVPDLEASLASLAKVGVSPMEGFPRGGAHGRIAFMQTDPRTGLLVELCQAGSAPAQEDTAP
ncbi:MAG: VOC family protein [Ramlibacter sp.]|nr:VOC family protein [Ramlibacter sp.]